MFFDCGASVGAELFIVEGRSAANAVNVVRDRQHQAVLALQGKIPNCATAAGLRKALKNQHVQELLSVLSGGKEKFDRLLILCDADADGLHARFLLTSFFHLQLSELVNRQIVFQVYPPLYQRLLPASGTRRFFWNDDTGNPVGTHRRVERSDGEVTYFKGIAGMPAEALWQTCVSAEQRAQSPVHATTG